MHHPTDRITHTTVFVMPVVEHWLGGGGRERVTNYSLNSAIELREPNHIFDMYVLVHVGVFTSTYTIRVYYSN